MMAMVLLLLVLLGAGVAWAAPCPATEGPWGSAASTMLDASVNFQVQSIVDGTDVELALSAEISGFLGFGLPEQTSGSMLGADIVTAVVDANGDLAIRDRFAPYAAYPFKPYDSVFQRNSTSPVTPTGDELFPTADCENGGTDDWSIVSFSQTGSVGAGTMCTQVILRRQLVTADVNDRPFEAGAMRVIWAHGGNDAQSLAYHGARRGTAIVTILPGPDALRPDPCESANGCEVVDLLMGNFAIPAVETTYASRDFIMVAPLEVNVSKHIIYFEEVVSDEMRPYVHHVVVSACFGNASLAVWQNLDFGAATLGADSTCGLSIYAWAVGSLGMKLPVQAGFPLGNAREDQILFFTLQTHYTNPLGVPGLVDNSGIRMHITTALRDFDAGSARLGGDGDSVIPTGVDDYHVQSTCPSVCTSWWPHPVTVFSSLLHMHSFGRQMWTTQYASNGDFKRVTNAISYWNFEFQQSTPVNFTIIPGDLLQTHCRFDTSKWLEPITFGLSSFDEMCINFLAYWPVVLRNDGQPAGAGSGCSADAFPPNPSSSSTQCDLATGEATLPGIQEIHLPARQGAVLPETFAPPGVAAECAEGGGVRLASGTFDDRVTASSDPRFEFEVAAFPGTRLFWRRVDENATLSVRVRVETAGNRWVSVGLAGPGGTRRSRMLGGRVVVGSAAALGVVNVYDLLDTKRSGVVLAGVFADGPAEFAQADGLSVLEFNASRIGDRALSLLPGASADVVILAVGSADAFPEQHVSQVVMALDWIDGSASLSGSDAAAQRRERARLAHGALMLAAFALLFPLGSALGFFKVRASYSIGAPRPSTLHRNKSVVARESVPQNVLREASVSANPRERVLFVRHVWVQVLGTVCAAAGVGVVAYFKTSPHLGQLHERIGVAVLGAVLLQVALGVFRPSQLSQPRWWTLLHRRVLPSAVLIGGMANLPLGVLLLRDVNGEQEFAVNDLYEEWQWLATAACMLLGTLGVLGAFARTKVRMCRSRYR